MKVKMWFQKRKLDSFRAKDFAVGVMKNIQRYKKKIMAFRQLGDGARQRKKLLFAIDFFEVAFVLEIIALELQNFETIWKGFFQHSVRLRQGYPVSVGEFSQQDGIIHSKLRFSRIVKRIAAPTSLPLLYKYIVRDVPKTKFEFG